MAATALDQALAFLVEADRLKSVERQTWLTDGSRQENSAEHSWHAALTAMVLAPFASEPVQVDRAIRMLLLHDLVEIDAGDTFLYDAVASADQAQRECAAADRLFGLLPVEQSLADRALWDEFEAGQTPDARFAKAVDRVNPVLLNLATQGKGWRVHGVRLEQVLARNAGIAGPLPAVWAWLRSRLEQAVEAGWLRP
ncbi:MAG: HD domain-containing protein [Abyssibacter sp.]|uniref:HD domain-containing protein n=1 Tax=Abyssibacter sp. TaxID=2320200 RepID=UPI00321AB633